MSVRRWDKEVPMTLSAVGSGSPVRWTYSTYGNFLNAYNIRCGINLTFNLSSEDDIKHKLMMLYKTRDCGMCSEDDVSELEERIRTLSNFERGGNNPKTLSGISEIGVTESRVVTVYRDGKPYKVKKREKKSISTDAQRSAAANARKYAHTDEANKKRRKSINARRDGKILGEV